jgi:hypothetical protein
MVADWPQGWDCKGYIDPCSLGGLTKDKHPMPDRKHEVNDSHANEAPPLVYRWQPIFGEASNPLIDFLQVINDELDAPITTDPAVVN